MDLYTLDDTFARKEVVEDFASLIWTERYNQYGDITLVLPSDSPSLGLVSEGTFLSIPESREVMLIDTLDDKEGKCTLTGQSLVAFLAQRMLRNTWHGDSTGWHVTGTSAGNVLSTIVHNMVCSGGSMDGSTILPDGNLEIINHLSVNDEADGSAFSIVVPFGDLYSAVKTVADADNIGFTLYPTNITGGSYDLYFDSYRGLDRTTDQDTHKVVVFEPAMDTLTDIETLRSVAGYKNVAIVWPNGITSQSQLGIAYAGDGETATSFKRRTLMVQADDVNVADYSSGELANILNTRAINALINNNYVRMTDGQLVPQDDFVYGTDYNLGDIIELQGESSNIQNARITEYIRSQDYTGQLAYPTLTVID